MDKAAKAFAAALLLTVAGVALAWQGQLVWTHGIDQSGQMHDPAANGNPSGDLQNGYLRSGGVPGQALYGWSYPFAFPRDPVAAAQITRGGESR
jgi:hypothetical protein